jgi:hypothetical protein
VSHIARRPLLRCGAGSVRAAVAPVRERAQCRCGGLGEALSLRIGSSCALSRPRSASTTRARPEDRQLVQHRARSAYLRMRVERVAGGSHPVLLDHPGPKRRWRTLRAAPVRRGLCSRRRTPRQWRQREPVHCGRCGPGLPVSGRRPHHQRRCGVGMAGEHDLRAPRQQGATTRPVDAARRR